MALSLKPKKTRRVYVLLTDPEVSGSRGFTVYGISLEEAYERMKTLFKGEEN